MFYRCQLFYTYLILYQIRNRDKRFLDYISREKRAVKMGTHRFALRLTVFLVHGKKEERQPYRYHAKCGKAQIPAGFARFPVLKRVNAGKTETWLCKQVAHCRPHR